MGQPLRLRAEAIVWRVIEGEVIALDARRSLYLGTNRSGALMWNQVADGTTREKLVKSLADAFALERDQAEADVDAFLASLEEHELLERQQ